MSHTRTYIVLIIWHSILLLAAPLIGKGRIDLLDNRANIVFQITHMESLKKTFESSSLHRLWHHPRMRPFINQGKILEAIAKDLFIQDPIRNQSDEIFTHIKSQMEQFNGEIVIGINIEPKGHLYAIAEMDSEEYRNIRSLEEKLKELEYIQSEIRKINISGIPVIEEIHRKRKNHNRTFQCHFRNNFIETTDREWLERVVVELKKSTFQDSVVPTISLKFNASLMDSLSRGNNPLPAGVLKGLGLEQLSDLKIDLHLKRSFWELVFTLKTRNRWEGFFTLFNRQAVPERHMLSYVPSDVYAYSVLRLDFNALWSAFPEIVQNINPQMAQQVTLGIQTANQMFHFDLGRDLFANLEPLITTYSDMDGFKEKQLYFFHVRSQEKAKQFFRKLFAEGTPFRSNKIVQLNPFAGHDIYRFGSVPATTPVDQAKSHISGGPVGPFAIAVVTDGIAWGPEKMIIAHIQAGNDRNHRENGKFYRSKMYRSMIRNIPEDASGYGMFHFSSLVKQLIGLMQNYQRMASPTPAKTEKKREEKVSHLKAFLQNLKFSKLPPADFISSFFDIGYQYSTVRRQAMQSRSVIFMKKQKEGLERR